MNEDNRASLHVVEKFGYRVFERTVLNGSRGVLSRATVSDFSKLWAGQTVSLLGTALTMFALPTLAVLVLHATPVQVGALSALQTLPFPILGMFVGVLADRMSRRKIMIVADAVRFAALATIPLTAAFGVLTLPQLYAVSLITGCASAFFGITYQSYFLSSCRRTV